MLGLGAIGQFAIGEVDFAAGGGAESITVDKWFQALSIPVRSLPGLRPSQQQFSALSDPYPFVSFSWFSALSIPAVKTRPGLKVGQQQFFAFQPAPSPFVATGWFAPLSEPVRFKRGLRPAQQQFFAMDTSAIPISRLIAWYMAMSEPVRFKPGLRAAQQQFLATPSRVIPTPDITGILDAIETKDTFLGAVSIWNRVLSGEIGVIEKYFTGAQISVVQRALSPGVSGVIEDAVPPASGTAVPTITTASIAIRIV